MTLIACWIVFPLVLASLACGCGFLLERLAEMRLPGVLVLPAGLAVGAVVAELATQTDATAELATPLVVICAVAGFVLSPRLAGRRLDGWAAAGAVAVFAVFAAPIVLSGEATFAGYLKIEDTATWAAITDHVMERGRGVGALEPSSYEVILDTYLGGGYPVGSFLPLGVGRALVGEDLAWLIQPYMAFLAAMLALSLYALSARAIESRVLRALVAFVAAQAALLFAYSLFGAIKELAAAWLIALIAALAPTVMREEGPARRALPLAIASAAALNALSVGGGVWLLPLLAPILVVSVVRRGERVADQAILFCVVAGLLSVPALLRAGSFLPVAGDVLRSQSELGNLGSPLDTIQAFGIWPVGDFRSEPDVIGVTYLLIGVLAASGVAGLIWAGRRRAYEALIFVGAVTAGALIVIAAGSPWADAKALAIASTALVFAGMMGAAAIFEAGPRVLGLIAAIAIGGGVLWSNALAYHEVDLAPRERMAELEEIGERIEGQGPTLTTEYEFWGVRHFLRAADPEGATLLRRRGVALATGEVPDVDRIELRDLFQYRTLVLRRSPLSSRPPSTYRLLWSGRYYEIWGRPGGGGAELRSHIPLGAGVPEATPSCDQVLEIARGTRRGDRLAVVERPPATLLDVTRSSHPASWEGEGNALYPDSSGTVQLGVRLQDAGRYGLWLRGQFRGRLELEVDGRELRTARNELSSGVEFVPMGSTVLSAGVHTVTLRYDGPSLRPGSGGDEVGSFGERSERPFSIGVVVLSRTTAALPVRVLSPDRARSLCGQPVDWIEVIGRS